MNDRRSIPNPTAAVFLIHLAGVHFFQALA